MGRKLIMYKVIYNGQVIDVLEKIKYYRYLKRSKRYVVCDRGSANCIQGSDNVTLYALRGVNLPEDFPHKAVIYKSIDLAEYENLKSILTAGQVINANTYILHRAREQKIEELKSTCQQEIFDGIIIRLSDGKLHQFELTIEDQLNLQRIESQLSVSSSGYIYHEKGKACTMFSKEDMMQIISAANAHINYHTTYFNLLKYCIYNMYDINAIECLRYGDEIPNSEYRNLLKQL